MATREDILNLQQRVKNAMTTLSELKKTPQPMSGDSWVMYRRTIAPDWDFEVTGITDTSYDKLFKVTYNVGRPDTGFMLWFVDYEYDQDLYLVMVQSTAPVQGDPYSIWLRIRHVTYTSDPGGVKVRFNIFSPQKGILTITEI
jgi:hypothetical protein